MDRAGADRRPVARVGLMTDWKVSREAPLDLALAVLLLGTVYVRQHGAGAAVLAVRATW